jgi:uncharacterized membrane protein
MNSDDTRAESPVRPLFRAAMTPVLALAGVAVAATLVVVFGHPHPHPLDTALLARQPARILVHLGAAVTALGLGVVQLVAPKGTLPHRLLGWIWVLLMVAVAGSSLFIQVINKGGFSPIHGLSAYVLVCTPLAVIAARRQDVEAHRGYMTGMFFLGLIVAGAFTFLPGRLMWSLFLGQ